MYSTLRLFSLGLLEDSQYADTRRTLTMVEVLTGTFTVKAGHAQMLKGGVIMDGVHAEHA